MQAWAGLINFASSILKGFLDYEKEMDKQRFQHETKTAYGWRASPVFRRTLSNDLLKSWIHVV